MSDIEVVYRVPRRCQPAGGPIIDSASADADQIPGHGAPAQTPAAGAPRKDYSRRERARIATLLSRAAHLVDRTQERPGLSYDVAELAALQWAIDEIRTLRGSLPEDLERLRAAIWR